MKIWLIAPVVATISGFAVSSPVDTSKSTGELLLATRATGLLSAWTSTGNGCSSNAGWTWTNPGQNQCIQFVGGDGFSKIVQRLSWSGQACQVYGYSRTGCTDQQATTFGSDICFNNILF